MILTAIDFDLEPRHRAAVAVGRAFRIRINHIVDSISLRIPKKTRTGGFHRLNVVAYEQLEIDKRFWCVEGVANIELRVPRAGSLLRASQPRAVKQVTDLLKVGVEIAGKNDALFAKHMELWRQLVATASEEFDHDLGISRSHRTRRWRCDAVLRITPEHYHYDLLVKESTSLETIERYRIKTTECALPFYVGVGFSKLRWDGRHVVVLTEDDDEVLRFQTSVPA